MEAKEKFNPKEHMIDLKGKDYLQVMWRLVWFREEHADWRITTQLIEHQYGDHAVFRAEISDSSQTLATGYGSESIKDFRDYLEKAETKAIGRALAILGYGTQFAPELEEGERIVDSPVTRGKTINNPTAKDIQNLAREVAAQKGAPIDEALVSQILHMAQTKNVDVGAICKRYHIDSVTKLTREQGEACLRDLNNSSGKQ